MCGEMASGNTLEKDTNIVYRRIPGTTPEYAKAVVEFAVNDLCPLLHHHLPAVIKPARNRRSRTVTSRSWPTATRPATRPPTSAGVAWYWTKRPTTSPHYCAPVTVPPTAACSP